MGKAEQARLEAASTALAAIRAKIDEKLALERQLEACDVELKMLWKECPPVGRTPLEMLIEERRRKSMLKAARGNERMANVLQDLVYGDDDE